MIDQRDEDRIANDNVDRREHVEDRDETERVRLGDNAATAPIKIRAAQPQLRHPRSAACSRDHPSCIVQALIVWGLA